MRRGTTPTYTLEIQGHDLTGATIEVAIRQGGTLVTKTGSELSVAGDAKGTDIAFRLTQEETLALATGKAEVQVRIIDASGEAMATDVGTIKVGRVLRDGVITYQGGQG